MALPSGQLWSRGSLKLAQALLGFHFIFYIGNGKTSSEITKYLALFFLVFLATVLCIFYAPFI